MEEEDVTRNMKSSVLLILIFPHKCQVSHHLEEEVVVIITQRHPPLAATSTGGGGGEEVVYEVIPGGQ